MGINRAANKIPWIFVTLVYAIAYFLFAGPEHHIVAAKSQNVGKSRAPRPSANNRNLHFDLQQRKLRARQ